eukprot:NODE_14173_length_1124_cov_5.376128.p1 GENE.NODE_14173_length_1124_cov_5.376128~~NODE_14173_length_1124_cov_5.376128.p1  ORF type:complete len:201 (+),score=22.32 NODE_14173_length_1124_cov_5.376128:321-923(+)
MADRRVSNVCTPRQFSHLLMFIQQEHCTMAWSPATQKAMQRVAVGVSAVRAARVPALQTEMPARAFSNLPWSYAAGIYVHWHATSAMPAARTRTAAEFAHRHLANTSWSAGVLAAARQPSSREVTLCTFAVPCGAVSRGVARFAWALSHLEMTAGRRPPTAQMCHRRQSALAHAGARSGRDCAAACASSSKARGRGSDVP